MEAAAVVAGVHPVRESTNRISAMNRPCKCRSNKMKLALWRVPKRDLPPMEIKGTCCVRAQALSVLHNCVVVTCHAVPTLSHTHTHIESISCFWLRNSVATIDYDYSKAYGGAGDTSVSSAGGTFGSNTQNNRASALDPASAAATGAALGSLSEGGSSFEAHYHDPNANVREEVMHIFAPPGKLGVVIDTPDDGAPVVHAVKDSSVIASKILVGDKLVAVDDEDVRSMTAIKVSKLISRKSANPSRKLTIVRTTVLE